MRITRSYRNAAEMPRALQFFFRNVFPLIFVAVGSGILYYGIGQLQLASESATWPSVEGRVVESEVLRKRDSEGSVTYHAEVFYEYRVAGMTYNGNRVAFGDYGSSDPGHARGIVNRYPADRRVDVHFHPGDPAEAVLETGRQGQAWFLPLFGSVFLAAGVLAFWGIRRMLPADESGPARPRRES